MTRKKFLFYTKATAKIASVEFTRMMLNNWLRNGEKIKVTSKQEVLVFNNRI